MDTQELKKLLKGSTTVLILEDGEPSFVILGYDAYKGLLGDRPAPEVDIPLRRGDGSMGQVLSAQRDGNVDTGAFQHRIGEKESELLEKINKQILALKDEVEKEEKGAEISTVD